MGLEKWQQKWHLTLVISLHILGDLSQQFISVMLTMSSSPLKQDTLQSVHTHFTINGININILLISSLCTNFSKLFKLFSLTTGSVLLPPLPAEVFRHYTPLNFIPVFQDVPCCIQSTILLLIERKMRVIKILFFTTEKKRKMHFSQFLSLLEDFGCSVFLVF